MDEVVVSRGVGFTPVSGGSTVPAVPEVPVSPPKRPSHVVKIILSIFVIGVLGVGLWAGVRLVSERQETRSRASGSDVVFTYAAPGSAARGEEFWLTVYIQPSQSNYSISAVSIPVTYPSSQVEFVSASAGAFFTDSFTSDTEMLNVVTPGTDLVTVNIGAPCRKIEPWVCYPEQATGAEVVATVKFRVRDDASGDVALGSSSDLAAAAIGQESTNVADATQLPLASVAVSGTATPTPTPTTTPGNATVTFLLYFQGIVGETISPPAKTASIILKQGDLEIYNNPAVPVAWVNGGYQAVITDIVPGTYTVFIKGWAHLTKKFIDQVVSAPVTTLDYGLTKISAGDINVSPGSSDIINALDLGRVIQDYFPDSPIGSIADLNLDGTVNGLDLGFVINNYYDQGDN